MSTVLSGGDVFDARTGEVMRADVKIDGDTIVAVETTLDGDQHVDVSGKTIFPGFIDCHVHLLFRHIDLVQWMYTPYSVRFYESVGNMAATLAGGVTTVRDAGGADLGMKESVERGLVPGPRMQIAIAMLSQTGGHGDNWLPSGNHLAVLRGRHPGAPNAVVDGPEEMRHKVRELIRAGADVIKVATSGGVLSPRDEPHHAHFQLDELHALVAEASAADRRVMAHAQAEDGIKNAIRAGIDSIEHGIYLDDEAIEMMLQRGTYLVPTLLAPTGVLEAAEAGSHVAPDSLRKAQLVTEVHDANVARAVQAGVKIAMGTDSAVTPHGRNLDELSLMVKAGMSPAAALQAATIEAATLMGWADRIGLIETGYFADMVVVDGDPMDLSGFRHRIDQVWKGGDQVA